MSAAVPEIISPKVVKWAERINRVFGRAVFSFIETGRECILAKADCSHGEWQQLVGRRGHKGLLRFKSTQAHYMMAIAKDERMVRHAEHLPPDSTSLYKLTLLTKPRFKQLLKNETINPSMKRTEASAETRKAAECHDRTPR